MPALGPTPDPRPNAANQLRDPERYQILGEHGRGGLGRVSRAHDRDLGRDIAIKELLARGHVSEVRFLREALITARLEHPGIVPVHEAGRWPDGTPFYAMKLVSGRPLRELIAERTTVDERIGLLHHVIAVADAIAYAHDRNIIHRDLKPANVIVGDFGETVVIDWGLAKDLTAPVESTLGGDSFRSTPDDDLTSAGSVLGTPAYMAPEQARGEHVDQRADVFAIGAMLWELCTLQKVPPTEPHLRRRMLRRTGLDKDLAAIIDKALDPDPGRRYPHAGALAADLKAFESGARIAARSYSLFALLAHWIRRHRALALSVTTATVLAATGIVVYVRNIAVERDRADAARLEAEAQRRSAENGRSELILQHAELLLHSDPTAAVTTLGTYHGDDEVARRRLLAEARGRGVASAVLSPHADTIWFLVGEPSGAIVSLGEDRKIRRTLGKATTTLANDVATTVLFDYAPAKRLLAYATLPSGIAILDLATLATTRLAIGPQAAMAVAPDGSSLATLEANGMVTVWALPSGRPSRQESIPGAIDLTFATPARLVIEERAALRTISLDAPPGTFRQVPLHVHSLDARADEVIVGDDGGEITLLSSTLEVVARLSVCHRRINTIQFVGRTNLATFACQDGLVGLVRFDKPARMIVELAVFSTLGAAIAAKPDPLGHWVVARSASNIVYVYDIERHLVHHYEGQGAQLSSIAPPTPEFDNFVVGDVNGKIRIWPLPSLASRTILEAPHGVFNVAFIPNSQELVTDGDDGIVRRISVVDGGVREHRGHRGSASRIVVSPDGGSIASIGSDRTIRVWRTSDGASLRTFAGHTAEIGDADYIESGRRIVSAGADGRLLAWAITGTDETLLFERPIPLVALEILRRNDHIVVADAAGDVWDVASPSTPRLVRAADSATVTLLRASPDGRFLAIGTDQGSVTVYETSDWTVLLATTAGGGIRQIAFDPKARDLVIASEDGHVRIAALDTRRALPWRDVATAARDVAYGPDGETIAFVCADGAWFYAVRDDTWVYARDHFSNTTSGAFSPDGKWFASSDRRGNVTLRDVAATLTAAPGATGPVRNDGK